MKSAFVILAAGKGERLGGTAKQFRVLGGKPVWRHSLDTALLLVSDGLISEIVLVFPTQFRQLDVPLPECVKIAHGGATRSLSVLSALNECGAELVFLHDAARPFVSATLCRRLLAAAKGENAVIPLLPEANALKKIDNGAISAIDRDGIYITQTPQLFPRAALKSALESSRNYAFKDEAELWLQLGRKLDYVLGERENFKITEEGDWRMACALARSGEELRNGLGYDVHPMMPGRPLVLGGVRIPSVLGLAGHSDADALCHAAADAILSAAGLPDIGTLYPASDDAYKGADSTRLLRDALERVKNEGWTLDWLSAVLAAQAPRLSPWHDRIVASLEKILGENRVSVTFKSGERVGAAGNSEAIFVWASATLRR